jgi:hypothetical protein
METLYAYLARIIDPAGPSIADTQATIAESEKVLQNGHNAPEDARLIHAPRLKLDTLHAYLAGIIDIDGIFRSPARRGIAGTHQRTITVRPSGSPILR